MDNFQHLASGKLTTAIVICCYSDKRWDILNKAIEAAARQVPAADEIVVIVDHNPALALRLRAKQFESPVRIVENIHPPGLSGARNTGISVSRGEVILFLDDDAVADQDLLAILVRQLEDPSVLGAVSAIRPLWETDRPSWFPDEFLWTLGCSYRGLHPGPVRNLIGASMCIRRDVFDHTGGFDSGLGRTAKALPLGCEETELCIRATKALPHGRFVFEPSSGSDHAIPADRATWKYFLHRCWAEGLSKASLSLMAGSSEALASEKTYMTRTLPQGFRRGFADVLRGQPSGLLRAAALGAGLTVTAAAFALGRTRAALTRPFTSVPARALEPVE
ncbi:glycosyltransferase [Rhizobium laguerreae]|uniref:glycosyltransferase family 2 protein n=1 Tax=Rhizobium laguerreae TaxID=1076926 RepID=UPI001C91146B|nr:glycosyltransferase [Rhizobium laguerreae]MBY3462855.1 glycosyltransferase [Rhizobium laguerreae]